MRRRWKLRDDSDWMMVAFLTWIAWDIGGVIATGLGSIPYHGRVRSWDVLIAVLWIFGAVIVPSTAGVIFGIRWLCANVVRDYESGPDLRETELSKSRRR